MASEESYNWNIDVKGNSDFVRDVTGIKKEKSENKNQTYEIIWVNGKKETIQAAQCILPSPDFFGDGGNKSIYFHGYNKNGDWRLFLHVDPNFVSSIRNLDEFPNT